MKDFPVRKAETGSLRRNGSLIVVLVLAVTLVGFLRGIKEPAPTERADVPREKSPRHDVAPEAVGYADLPNRASQTLPRSDLSQLVFSKPSPFEPVVRTDEMKMQALEDRSRTRAFDGAPPVIPHPVDFTQASNCIACHGAGLRVGDKLATKLSHPYFTNCTQCHIESVRPEFLRFASTPSDNVFIGAARAGAGHRAWPGAPPTIPHTTWMRQDCTSCHGLVARPGIRTTHPWLSNCVQCHALGAELDQVAFPVLR